jgi:hypothetical protein
LSPKESSLSDEERSSSSPSLIQSTFIINNDKDNIYNARQIILIMIANTLKTNESVVYTSCEMIGKAGIITNYIYDSIGYLLLVQEIQMVQDLLESLYNDLDKKLSTAMSIENEGYYDQRQSCNSALDEGLVAQLTAKGFPRHTAKRAILATKVYKHVFEYMKNTYNCLCIFMHIHMYLYIYLCIYLYTNIYVFGYRGKDLKRLYGGLSTILRMMIMSYPLLKRYR